MFERILLASMLALFLYGCGGSDNEGDTFPEPSPGPYIPDDDKDGLNDEEDSCLGTPEDEINAIDENGCSAPQLDGDSDGVINRTDLCPDTAEGAVVDGDGCSAVQRDTDMDGVDDSIDVCPTTPADLEVDAVGCADPERDDDGDSVLNAVDECPNTAADATVNAVGCADAQLDTDSDGVDDAADACPATEADAEVDADGCSQPQQDADGDSVANAADLCAATPDGEGVGTDGCASSQKDSDGDEVFDSVDLCPLTVADAAVDVNGCSDSQNDLDSDGVANASDVCPDSMSGASVDADGCSDDQLENANAPIMRTSGRGVLDSAGNPFLMRGVNLQYGDSPDVRLGGIAPIAEVGSNLVRLQLRENTTAAQLAAALDLIVENNMVAMVLLWETEGKITCTPESEFLYEAVSELWLGSWKSVLTNPRYQPYLMINIANEWGPMNTFDETSTHYDSYVAIYRDIIARFRNEGILAPLVIDAPHCGQDWYAFMRGRGQSIIDADPEENVLLSLHAYNFLYNTQEEVDTVFDRMNTEGFPYIFGEFGDSRFDGSQAVDHLYLMDRAQEEGIGWIAWSWKGNGSFNNQTILDMSTSEDSVALTEHGIDIVESGFGLEQTAALAEFVDVINTEPMNFSETGAEAVAVGDVIVSGDGAELRANTGDPATNPSLTWTFDIPRDGDYVMTIGYVNNSAENERAQNISFDGGSPETRAFPISADGESVSTHTLTAGTHTLQISANWGFMTILDVTIVDAPVSMSFTGADADTRGDVRPKESEGAGAVELQNAGDPTPPAVIWTFDLPYDGDYVFSLDYVSDNDGRQQDIIIDGGDPSRVTFPIADSPYEFTMTLQGGRHTYEVLSAWGFMTLKSLTISSAE